MTFFQMTFLVFCPVYVCVCVCVFRNTGIYHDFCTIIYVFSNLAVSDCFMTPKNFFFPGLSSILYYIITHSYHWLFTQNCQQVTYLLCDMYILYYMLLLYCVCTCTLVLSFVCVCGLVTVVFNTATLSHIPAILFSCTCGVDHKERTRFPKQTCS